MYIMYIMCLTCLTCLMYIMVSHVWRVRVFTPIICKHVDQSQDVAVILSVLSIYMPVDPALPTTVKSSARL
jgi:hypothetical protein